MSAADHTAIFPPSASPDAQAARPVDAVPPYFTFGRTLCSLRQHVVRPRGRATVDAYECKRDPTAFEADALKVFRAAYPKGKNLLPAPVTGPAYVRRIQGSEVTVFGLDDLP